MSWLDPLARLMPPVRPPDLEVERLAPPEPDRPQPSARPSAHGRAPLPLPEPPRETDEPFGLSRTLALLCVPPSPPGAGPLDAATTVEVLSALQDALASPALADRHGSGEALRIVTAARRVIAVDLARTRALAASVNALVDG